MCTKTRMWDSQNQHLLPVSTYQFLPAAPGSDCCRSPAATTNTQLLYPPAPWSLIACIVDNPDLLCGDGAHLAAAAGHGSQVQAAVAAVHPHAGLCGSWVLWLGVLGVDAGKGQSESAAAL